MPCSERLNASGVFALAIQRLEFRPVMLDDDGAAQLQTHRQLVRRHAEGARHDEDSPHLLARREVGE